MIIYEVNLEIKSAIFEAYYQWLLAHIDIMLTYPGFMKAQIFVDREEKSSYQKIVILYQVASEQDLHHYFANKATAMQSDGKKRFGDQFTATRRILQHQTTLYPKPQ